MGMGHAACFAVTIDEDGVKELVPHSYQYFLARLQEHNLTLDEFTQAMIAEYDYEMIDKEISEEDSEIIHNAYEDFKGQFKKFTGMDIELDYHNSEDEGDRYDQLSGYYFGLDFADVFQRTPMAQALDSKAKIEIKQFVQFG